MLAGATTTAGAAAARSTSAATAPTLLRAGVVGPSARCRRRSRGPTTSRPVRPVRTTESTVKSPDVIARMRVAWRIARDVLARDRRRGRARRSPPTSSTASRTRPTSRAASTRARCGTTGFPKSVCTSVNEVICHGIPDDRALVEGDIVNLDVTVYVDGVHGDTNATFCVGRVDPESRRLVQRHRGVPRPRDRGRAPGRAALRHRARDRDPRPRRRLLRGAGVRRTRHRRGVPRAAAGAALLRARRLAPSWSRAWSSPSSP